jgi:hypothetical protein
MGLTRRDGCPVVACDVCGATEPLDPVELVGVDGDASLRDGEGWFLEAEFDDGRPVRTYAFCEAHVPETPRSAGGDLDGTAALDRLRAEFDDRDDRRS